MSKRKYAINLGGVSRTEQSHIDDTDINVIMKRALRGQSSDYIRENAESYGEATSLDLFEAKNLILEGEQTFAEFPSKIRNRFKNNIGEFLDFIQDPENMPEAIELGLVKKPTETPVPIPEPTPAKTTPIKEEAPPASD